MRITLAAVLAASLAGCSPPQTVFPGPGQATQAQLAASALARPSVPADYNNPVRIAEEHRARAECSMRAQEANSNNWGLIHGFFAGLGTGSACINYYREIGVIR